MRIIHIPANLQTDSRYRKYDTIVLVEYLNSSLSGLPHKSVWQELKRRRYVRLERLIKQNLPVKYTIDPVIVGQICSDLNYTYNNLPYKENFQIIKYQIERIGKVIGITNDYKCFPQPVRG